MTEPLYVIHENELGEKKYQPRFPNGAKLWLMPRFRPAPLRIWGTRYERDWKPVLYRSARRAERVARREMARDIREERKRHKWEERKSIRDMRNNFKEVQS